MDKSTLVWLLIMVVVSEGKSPCPPNDFKFYNRTHSCFSFPDKWLKGHECTPKCEEYKGGPSGETKGYLARILDADTQKFVYDSRPDVNARFIGLTDEAAEGVYRWEGLPNFQPRFLPWKKGHPKLNASIRHVVMTRGPIGGAGLWQKYEDTLLCICELPAATPLPKELSNQTARLALGSSGINQIACSYSLSWTKFYWIKSGLQETRVAECNIAWTIGIPNSCTSCVAGYEAIITAGVEFILRVSNVSTADEGKWKCKFDHPSRGSEEGLIDVSVYDIDECKTQNGGCWHMCNNTQGSWVCSCGAGFSLVKGHICKDIDECLEENGGCEQTCRNSMGSRSCTCHEGFVKFDETSCRHEGDGPREEEDTNWNWPTAVFALLCVALIASTILLLLFVIHKRNAGRYSMSSSTGNSTVTTLGSRGSAELDERSSTDSFDHHHRSNPSNRTVRFHGRYMVSRQSFY